MKLSILYEDDPKPVRAGKIIRKPTVKPEPEELPELEPEAVYECPGCGALNYVSDQFCETCGLVLRGPRAADQQRAARAREMDV